MGDITKWKRFSHMPFLLFNQIKQQKDSLAWKCKCNTVRLFVYLFLKLLHKLFKLAWHNLNHSR